MINPPLLFSTANTMFHLPPKTSHPSPHVYLLMVCAGLFFILFTLVGMLIHHNLGTSAHDLGVFDQAYWRYSTLRGTFNTVLGFSILGDHFGVLALVFGPLYAIYPSVAWPLAAQALSMAVGGLILYGVVRQRIPASPTVALAIALCYYLHPAVHNSLLWQFHEIGLASGLYMGLILCYIKKIKTCFWFASLRC